MAAKKARIALEGDMIVARLRAIAMANPLDFYIREPDGSMRPMRLEEIAPEQKAAIAAIIPRKKGEHEIRLHDPLKALELLARHMGMLHDKLEIKSEASISIRLPAMLEPSYLEPSYIDVDGGEISPSERAGAILGELAPIEGAQDSRQAGGGEQDGLESLQEPMEGLQEPEGGEQGGSQAGELSPLERAQAAQEGLPRRKARRAKPAASG